MKLPRLSCVLAVAVLAFNFSARAELKLPAIFGDNMLLQQQQHVPVWGWAAPGATVTVKFAGQSKSARADAEGKWIVKLGKLKASFTPQTLVIEAGDTRTYTNILVGEVWLASGQSNMEKPIGVQRGQKPVFNAEVELATANFPSIRIFKIEKMFSATIRTDLEKFECWQECNSNALNSMSFSAAAYFFGREIHTNLNVPVGLIESSWGGTRIEPWTPPAGFASVPSLGNITASDFGTNKISNTAPTVLYNAMIAPIAGFAMRGALWYQGESNRSDTNYDAKMSALIGGWRKVWNEGVFPFYFVQIAPFKYIKDMTNYVADTDPLPRLWLQQSRAARHIKKTGMIVTTDLVDDLNDIHPRDKATVGHRLALLALDKTYDTEVPSESPAFAKMKIAGNKAVLEFEHEHGGLVSKDGRPLTWFAIAGDDGKFVPAEAKIIGRKIVEVSAVGVAKPVAVRFAWHQLAQPNLFNGADLPAEPFSTQIPVE
ncbi:MAG: sialate O-acetylesterase [Verrucomicrobiota bacterium]